ncbi:helix-turn-helix transcriptional regulator [Candidatus Sulfurimonas marisnigri]|uniref:Helix-turn-helix transcriptional regulator n=1 Tax=Candidatus Sulfurimonas marisnigri TaxID=2740405 RepID=A0A7S7RR18_9BACT|nr:helix-turn-helix transcriptional regulator [Candidatus Sulfurimonas marisnigri]QOY55168.1 helix-turn-helix transcriptional regulator [Candidatus Sulfurimonas marisnigri]
MQESIIFSDKEILLMYKNIGKNVKKCREEKGLSQLQLSHSMGYSSVSLVSAAELASDNKHFNLEHLYKISKILDIELSYLISVNAAE